MKLLRPVSPFLLVLVTLTALSAGAFGFDGRAVSFSRFLASDELTAYSTLGIAPKVSTYDFYADHGKGITTDIVKTPVDGGIREDVPAKYRERYDRWKAELLSTAYGREQWDKYADNKNFILTIVVTGDRKKGAGTDKFLWDDAGRFVGATITLGANLDEGYPNPIYYPVLNSLASDSSAYSISGRILAAKLQAGSDIVERRAPRSCCAGP